MKLRTFLPLCATLLLVPQLCLAGAPAAASGNNDARAGRTLVFIVPGTFGNDSFWPTLQEGKSTFASELLRGLGDAADIYPYLWTGDDDHVARMAAAKALAALIDQKAAGFDRVCIVGHSHGGNIALAAAGLCKTKIDSVICLSTPSVYVRMRNADGKDLNLPVYCTPQSRQNIKTIVTICPWGDDVPDFWANAMTGLEETVALPLTQEWQEKTGFPRLPDDGMFTHLFSTDRVFCNRTLNIADANLSIQSLVASADDQHSAVHSRRMGYVVGTLIHDQFAKDQINYINTLAQPVTEDQGEPVPLADEQAREQNHDKYFNFVGWRLQNISINLNEQAKQAADDEHPDPYVKIAYKDGQELFKTHYQTNSMTGTWSTDYVIWTGQADVVLGVWADRTIRDDAYLGGWYLQADQQPPSTLKSDDGHFWSANLDWCAIHY